MRSKTSFLSAFSRSLRHSATSKSLDSSSVLPAYLKTKPRNTSLSRYDFSSSPFGMPGNFGIRMRPSCKSTSHISAIFLVFLIASGKSLPQRSIISCGGITWSSVSLRVIRFGSDRLEPVPTQSSNSCVSWSSCFR